MILLFRASRKLNNFKNYIIDCVIRDWNKCVFWGFKYFPCLFWEGCPCCDWLFILDYRLAWYGISRRSWIYDIDVCFKHLKPVYCWAKTLNFLLLRRICLIQILEGLIKLIIPRTNFLDLHLLNFLINANRFGRTFFRILF